VCEIYHFLHILEVKVRGHEDQVCGVRQWIECIFKITRHGIVCRKLLIAPTGDKDGAEFPRKRGMFNGMQFVGWQVGVFATIEQPNQVSLHGCFTGVVIA
jgi:hypothetical protein